MVATHSRNGYASVDALLSLAPLEETDHTLSNGAKVRFRKLSRHGQLKVKAYAAKPDYDEEEGERLLFSFCLVAEPPFDGAEDERLIRMQDEMDTTVLLVRHRHTAQDGGAARRGGVRCDHRHLSC
jgi:hypothetical protein